MTRIAASVNKYGGVRMEIKKTAGRRSEEDDTNIIPQGGAA